MISIFGLYTINFAAQVVNGYIKSFFLFLLIQCIKDMNGLTLDEIENHLELGRELLARGQYNDALSHFHEAVAADPSNYLTFFRRATVYLALGKPKAALDDLDEIIQLKPDFFAARLQRGSVLLKQGRLDEAHIDFEWVLRNEPYNEEAIQYYNSIEPLKQDLQTAYFLLSDGDYHSAINLLTRLLHDLPWDVQLREMRANCFEKLSDITNAISDLRATTKMRSDNTEGYLKLSSLHYEIGEAEESLSTIRECLRLDPDHKACWAHYKKVKKLAAQIKSMNEFAEQNLFQECIEKAEAALKTESKNLNIVNLIKAKQCHCLLKDKNANEAVKVCSEALVIHPNDVNVLCDRAEAYLLVDNLDNAKSDFNAALNLEQHLKRAEEGLRRVAKLEKLAKSRNYYEILGISRTANKKEILKAYRKLAQKWHPDNFQGDEKKEAEKKFIDIAAAKEVLTDPEKRSKFDNGEDPLNPESQTSQGFNPFFHPFTTGGSGFQFRFHF